MVQTHLVARLLGLRVLKVDGVVQLAPARLEVPQVGAPAVTAVDGAVVGTAQPPALGGGLARAARLLEDGDQRLG